jgi:hypothetical protein
VAAWIPVLSFGTTLNPQSRCWDTPNKYRYVACLLNGLFQRSFLGVQVNSISVAVLDGALVLVSCGNDRSIKVFHC